MFGSYRWENQTNGQQRITQDGFSKSKVDLCEVCSLRVKANTVLCAQCGRWIHGICAGVKRVTPKFSRNLHAENVRGILERQWSKMKRCVMKWKQ